MFADDLALVSWAVKEFSAVGPFVECGGLSDPVIAEYAVTIAAMEKLGEGFLGEGMNAPAVRDAQMARYLRIHRPLEASCPEYVCENPETGGLAISDLWTKYNDVDQPRIGTAILLSVLEHVDDPFEAAEDLRDAMAPGGLAIASVPFMFPEHPSPRDLWRFTPDGLRAVFEKHGQWEVLWCDWRLRIAADAGVLCSRTGKPQAIESCALIGRAA